MSPSGALHYVKDIEEIAMDLTDMIVERRCEDGSTEEGLDLIESMNHIMKEGLKMIFLPLKAFKMFPGWSTTKKHYDRIMEINYRRVTGAMEKLDLDNESDN